MNSFGALLASAAIIISPALYIIAQALGWRRYSLLTIFFPEEIETNPVWKVIRLIGALIAYGIGILFFAYELNF